MRERRAQQGAKPLRTLCAFDPRRSAILLLIGVTKPAMGIGMTPRAQERSATQAERMLAAMPLNELRQDRKTD